MYTACDSGGTIDNGSKTGPKRLIAPDFVDGDNVATMIKEQHEYTIALRERLKLLGQ